MSKINNQETSQTIWTGLEAFCEFHARHSGNEVEIARHFPLDSSEEDVQVWSFRFFLPNIHAPVPIADITTDLDGNIRSLDFGFSQEGSIDAVPMLVGTINWLLAELQVKKE